MNLTWESIAAILGMITLVTGLIAFFSNRKRATQDEVKSQEATKASIVAVDNKQDLKIKELERDLVAVKKDVVELKSNITNLDVKIFNAVDKINDKIDNLITTLINK